MLLETQPVLWISSKGGSKAVWSYSKNCEYGFPKITCFEFVREFAIIFGVVSLEDM